MDMSKTIKCSGVLRDLNPAKLMLHMDHPTDPLSLATAALLACEGRVPDAVKLLTSLRCQMPYKELDEKIEQRAQASRILLFAYSWSENQLLRGDSAPTLE